MKNMWERLKDHKQDLIAIGVGALIVTGTAIATKKWNAVYGLYTVEDLETGELKFMVTQYNGTQTIFDHEPQPA